MKLLMKRLWKEEEGQDLTEYALLLTPDLSRAGYCIG